MCRFFFPQKIGVEHVIAHVEMQTNKVRRQHPIPAAKHQREVGTAYFDAVTQAITHGSSSLSAFTGSTEEEQFEEATV